MYVFELGASVGFFVRVRLSVSRPQLSWRRHLSYAIWKYELLEGEKKGKRGEGKKGRRKASDWLEKWKRRRRHNHGKGRGSEGRQQGQEDIKMYYYYIYLSVSSMISYWHGCWLEQVVVYRDAFFGIRVRRYWWSRHFLKEALKCLCTMSNPTVEGYKWSKMVTNFERGNASATGMIFVLLGVNSFHNIAFHSTFLFFS